MNAADILKYGHRTLLQAVEGLPESAWETGGVSGIWSTKHIMAHMASQEHVLLDVLTTFLGGGPTPHLDRHNDPGLDFNMVEVDARKDLTVAETLAEYNDTHARVMELITQIPAETLRQPGTLPWYGMEYALDDFIVYGNYGHKREHSAQIGAFRDRLGQQQPATR